MEDNLYLSVKTAAWRPDGQFESNKNSWDKIRKEILDRDRFTCQFCGFEATKYQEVHHIDGDHDNCGESNLVTACALCHACHHIGLAGAMKRGTLVWLPEVSQQDIHWMSRWLNLSVYSESMGGYLDGPKRSFDDFLIHRKKQCESRFGTSDPVVLGNNLLKFGETSFSENAMRILQPIRMVPATITNSEVTYFSGYSKETIDHWRERVVLLVSDMTQVAEFLNAGMKNLQK